MLKKTFLYAGGRIILQDLQRTVAEAKLTDGAEAIAYNFFTP